MNVSTPAVAESPGTAAESPAPWERPFGSFAEAAQACGASYADADLTRFRLLRGQGMVQELSRTAPSIPCWYLVLAAAAAHARDRKGGPPAILDFGGAVGEGALYLRHLLGGHDYRVVENSALAAALAADPAFGHARFESSLGSEPCGVFFSSGALQYVAEPYEVLAAAFRLATCHVVLTRNLFSRGGELAAVQRSRLHDNGAGPLPAGFPDRDVLYPVRSLDWDRVAALATEAGWEVFFENSDPDVPDWGEGRLFGKNLVFARRG